MAKSGRPREFDDDVALSAALSLFWRRGYEATSVDGLARAMGIGRSSFYGAFGSKHSVLLAALNHYCDKRFVEFTGIAAAVDAREAIREFLHAIADLDSRRDGCFLLNCIVELLPQDPDVEAISRRHLDRVGRLMAGLLVRAGVKEEEASQKTCLLVSAAWGAGVLRKTGARVDFEDLLPALRAGATSGTTGDAD